MTKAPASSVAHATDARANRDGGNQLNIPVSSHSSQSNRWARPSTSRGVQELDIEAWEKDLHA